jgi:hypothetical protein
MAQDDGRRRGAGFDVLEACVGLTRLDQLEDHGHFVVDPEMESLVERLGIVAVTYIPLSA